MERFKKKIEELYNLIIQPIDLRFKKIAIEKYKQELNILNESFGNMYVKLIAEVKSKGVVYTPFEIADYIARNTVDTSDIITNPFLKICDPSCGSGNILITVFKYLKEVYADNLEEINNKNNLKLSIEDIDEHILKYNLYGFDIDETALKILVIDLFCLTEKIFNNGEYSDFLIDEKVGDFDFFIGNPPYVGQKSIDKEYSNTLKKIYKGVYKDKGDLSYCFFKKAIIRLKKGGRLGFITSRYFLEAPSGIELRKILKDECKILKIVDFYGIRPFKGIGIDPVIVFLENELNSDYEFTIIKPFNDKESKKNFFSGVFQKENASYKNFNIQSNDLDNESWKLINDIERGIISKIESKCKITLKDICESYQGIITGCDKAFVVSEEDIKEERLEKDIIKPWIKSSFIEKCSVNRQNNYLIYSNLIHDEKKYPNTILHIGTQKERLMNRREYKKGYRKWYELQWGRVSEIFEGEKIIFPFKSNSNRFAVDKGSYFSADVYCLTLKENVNYSYKSLMFLLNSNIYEFYFKTFAKKLGEDLYEYYPNNLMKLRFPERIAVETYDENELYNYFELNEMEIKIIKNI